MIQYVLIFSPPAFPESAIVIHKMLPRKCWITYLLLYSPEALQIYTFMKIIFQINYVFNKMMSQVTFKENYTSDPFQRTLKFLLTLCLYCP